MCCSGDYDEDGGGGGAAKMANALQDGGVDKVDFLNSLPDGIWWKIYGSMEFAINFETRVLMRGRINHWLHFH